MNLATTVLIALAIHFGGADVDLAQNVSMEWFRSSRLERAWELRQRSDGVYSFSAGEIAAGDAAVGDTGAGDAAVSSILVERLSAPDRTYSVTHQRGDRVVVVSVISLVDLPRGSTVGRAGPVGTPLYVERDGVLAAIARDDPDGSGMVGDESMSDERGVAGAGTSPEADADTGTADAADAVAGEIAASGDPAVNRYEITRGRGLITLIDAESAQVLTVRF